METSITNCRNCSRYKECAEFEDVNNGNSVFFCETCLREGINSILSFIRSRLDKAGLVNK